jgi:hypothetical protein
VKATGAGANADAQAMRRATKKAVRSIIFDNLQIWCSGFMLKKVTISLTELP